MTYILIIIDKWVFHWYWCGADYMKNNKTTTVPSEASTSFDSALRQLESQGECILVATSIKYPSLKKHVI